MNRVISFPGIALMLLLCIHVNLASAASADDDQSEPSVYWTDSDNDGVTDDKDQCPNTGYGYLVTSEGCPRDTDGDGVPDYKDKCPDTEPGKAACSYGCEYDSVFVINLTNDEFDFDQAVLKPEMEVALDAMIADIANLDKLTDLLIVGHTDSTGTDEYNQKLSERRAQAVKNYLVNKGLPAAELETRGMGESSPVNDNKTAQNRAKNRRVELLGHSKKVH